MSPKPLPKTVGRFEVLDRLGHGGMGVVYRARDPRIDRLVAIKVLRVDDETLRDRFIREAQAAGKLAHRNIVTIYDVGEFDDQPYIVMEYVDGQSLGALLRTSRSVRLMQLLNIVDDVCAALDYAHQRGVVHRDVKPANVMIGPQGLVKLVDFGIASLSDSTLTLSGAMIGTPHYMSPEQIEGRQVDRRSDIFAVGLVLYEALCGRRAFAGDTPHAVMHAIVSGAAPSLRSIAAGIRPDLEAIVERAMQRLPSQRFQTLGEMRRQLDAVRHQLVDEFGDDAGTMALPTPLPTPHPIADDRNTPGVDSALERVSRRRAEQISAHLAEAQRAFDGGQFDIAIDACERALMLNPDESACLRLMARARATLDQLLERQRLVEQELQEARAHLVAGDAPSALAATGRALERDPTNSDAQEITRRATEFLDAQRRREDLERQRVQECQRLFSVGRRAEAIAGLERLKASSSLAAATLDGLRAELARIEQRAIDEELRAREDAERLRRQAVELEETAHGAGVVAQSEVDRLPSDSTVGHPERAESTPAVATQGQLDALAVRTARGVAGPSHQGHAERTGNADHFAQDQPVDSVSTRARRSVDGAWNDARGLADRVWQAARRIAARLVPALFEQAQRVPAWSLVASAVFVSLAMVWFATRPAQVPPTTAVSLAPRPEPPVVPAQIGLLVIDATPWAEIVEVVDSQGAPVPFGNQRYTPLALSVNAGDYRVTIKDPTSPARRELTARVEAGGTGRATTSFRSVDSDDYFERAGFGERRP